MEGCELIQNAMPNLSADEREFLMTGITPEEWAELSEDECSLLAWTTMEEVQ